MKVYDVKKKDFIFEKGTYTFEVSSSSIDTRLKSTLSLSGEELINPYSKDVNEYYNDLNKLTSIPNDKFEELLGYKIEKKAKQKKITFETPIGDYTTWFGKFFRKTVIGVGMKQFKKAEKIEDPLLRERKKKAALFVARMMPNNSLRSLCYSSSGALKYPVAQGLLYMCNNRFIKGLITMCKKDK